MNVKIGCHDSFVLSRSKAQMVKTNRTDPPLNSLRYQSDSIFACDVRTYTALGDTVFGHYSPVTHIAVATYGKFFVFISADCI